MAKRAGTGGSKEKAAPPGDVLASLPYGVVLIGPDREVRRANPAAAELLPALESGDERCDKLLACTAPGGPCEHGCLAERAAATGEALPEIRIDTGETGSVSAVWVTAAPVGTAGEALLHLRPGDARDRRRRSDPHWVSGPDLRIRAFGRMHIDSPEGPIGGRWLQQRPGHVLKYLTCERNRVVHAEEIAEALWPSAGRQGLNNVRHFVHALREKLEPGRPKGADSSFIVTVRDGYAIDRRNVQIDADEFEAAVEFGLSAAKRGANGEAVERLGEAVALYGGEFLEDEPYADWAYEERERLRGLAGRALRTLADVALGERDLAGAAGHLERLAEIEAYDGEVHRKLFAVMLAQGRRSEAARRFAAYRVRMLREFGEEPDFQLADIAAAISKRS